MRHRLLTPAATAHGACLLVLARIAGPDSRKRAVGPPLQPWAVRRCCSQAAGARCDAAEQAEGGACDGSHVCRPQEAARVPLSAGQSSL